MSSKPFPVHYLRWHCHIYVSWENTKQQLLICCWYLEPWANSFGMCYRKISILCKWRPQRSHVAGEGIIKQWPPAVSDFYWMAIFLWWNTAFSVCLICDYHMRNWTSRFIAKYVVSSCFFILVSQAILMYGILVCFQVSDQIKCFVVRASGASS